MQGYISRGIWDIDDLYYLKRDRRWPVLLDTDPNYASASLLLTLRHNLSLTSSNDRFIEIKDWSAQNATPTLNVTPAFFPDIYYQNNFLFSANQRVTFNFISAYTFGTGDFCIETWVNLPTNTSDDFNVVAKSSLNDSWGTGWTVSRRSNNTFYLSINNATAKVSTTSTPPNGRWVHIAFTRSGTTLRAFFNGQIEGSVTNNENITTASPLVIGNDISTDYNLGGYVQDLRIYKGIAKYTNAFTPPSPILV